MLLVKRVNKLSFAFSFQVARGRSFLKAVMLLVIRVNQLSFATSPRLARDRSLLRAAMLLVIRVVGLTFAVFVRVARAWVLLLNVPCCVTASHEVMCMKRQEGDSWLSNFHSFSKDRRSHKFENRARATQSHSLLWAPDPRVKLLLLPLSKRDIEAFLPDSPCVD